MHQKISSASEVTGYSVCYYFISLAAGVFAGVMAGGLGLLTRKTYDDFTFGKLFDQNDFGLFY